MNADIPAEPISPESPVSPRHRAGKRIAVWTGSLLILAATLGVIAWLGWLKYREIQVAMKMPPPPEMPTSVAIEPVGTVQWRNSTVSIGTILAPRSITVNNEMPGTVAEVLFEPGQIVEEGAVLLRLDSSVENAQLKAAQAREKFALAAFRRNQAIGTNEGVSESELENVESRWQQAVAEVEELQALIARKTIAAPFRSRVGLSTIQKGQYLSSGSLITTLQSVEDHLLVEFTVAQTVSSQIHMDDSVTASVSGKTFDAKISAIDAQADRQTRHIRVRAKIGKPPEGLSPGESVSVRLEYGPAMELPAVPAESVRRSPQGTFVFIAEKSDSGDLRASARSIVPAATAGSMMALAQGVSVGEMVVVEGSFKLHDGALLSVAGESSPAVPDP